MGTFVETVRSRAQKLSEAVMSSPIQTSDHDFLKQTILAAYFSLAATTAGRSHVRGATSRCFVSSLPPCFAKIDLWNREIFLNESTRRSPKSTMWSSKNFRESVHCDPKGSSEVGLLSFRSLETQAALSDRGNV